MLTEQQAKDLADGEYNRHMRDIEAHREKRNKLISALCERLQAIRDEADCVNQFDADGLRHPLSLLEEAQKRLMVSVEELNNVASAAGKPRMRLGYARFSYHGVS